MASNDFQNQEEPLIELYMYSLSQEFPHEKGHATFLKRMNEVKAGGRGGLTEIATVETQVYSANPPESWGARDWGMDWRQNSWVTNHDKIGGMGILEASDPMLRARVREEDFGGLVFEPTSDRVFRLNRPGYRLFGQLREFYHAGNRDLTSFAAAAGSEPVRRFIAYLEGAGLWVR